MLNLQNVDWGKVGKVGLTIAGIACTIGSALIGDAKQKATISEEAAKAAEAAVAKALESK